MAYATIEDVENRWRPLVGIELTNATAWLDDASAIIRSRVANVADRITADADYAALVTGITAEVVVRRLRNPQGKRSEQIDDYSYTLASVSPGLFLTKDEVADLTSTGAPAGAFSIRAPADPGYRIDTSDLLGWS